MLTAELLGRWCAAIDSAVKVATPLPQFELDCCSDDATMSLGEPMTPRDETTPFQTKVAGKTLYIYAGDHPPPHAHVRVNPDVGGMLVINLATLRPLANMDFNPAALRAAKPIRRAMQPMQEELLVAWLRLNPKIH